MTVIGWIMMIVSCGFVVGLLLFCVARVWSVAVRERAEADARSSDRADYR